VSLVARAIGMWLVLLALMMGNGFLRVLVLQPRLGEDAARQAASLLGIGFILGASALFVRRLGEPGSAALLRIGALWLLLTLAFEFLFGHYVSGLSWQALLGEYDISRGRLWPLVLLTTLVAPWLAGRARRA
jgi:hypothetical protein